MQKTTFKTRLLALLTAAFMIVMCVPFAAFADNGTKTAHITFRAVENGTLNDDKDVVTYSVADVDGAQVAVPTVKAAEGYEFDGWTCNTDAVLDAAACGQKQFIAGWAYYYQDSTDGFVEFTANFKKKAEEVKPVEKTAHITFRAVENGTLNDGKDVVTYDVADVDGAQVAVPTVKAAEGYEFDGWTCNTDAVLDAAACGQKQFIAGWAFYYQDGPDGYVEFTANFKKKATEPEQPETQRKYFHVYFTVDPEKGSFTDYGKGPVTFEGYEDEVGNQQYDVPAVTAKPGYKFVGWKGQGASEIALDADAKTFGVTGLCFYENGKYDGYASIEAVFEPTVKLTDIKVNFLKEDGKTVVSNAQYIAKDATLVLPYDVEGVTGWKLANNLTTYDVKTKFSFNDLAAFVGTNYTAEGTAELTFYAQYKTEVELKNIAIKYVEDKNGAQEDVAAPQNNFTAKDEFTILADNLYDGKVPAGKKLIGWQYKNGGNTTNFVKGEHVKFDTLKALLNGNWDNEGNAWVTLTPVFQDVKSDNGNSSSSSSSNASSSSSSSSNKTTTSASQKQVVKAAAAPANTTKVLPKTGATNAAPLIGGSLAVVALLMGYGVYGLVLRKKD